MQSRVTSVSLTLASIIGASLALAACTKDGGGGLAVGAQGWSPDDQAHWYEATQGSRLIPYTWFAALEQPGSDKPFADPAWLEGFGYLSSAARRPDVLPVGFAIDRQGDEKFKVTKLRWYDGQTGASERDAEPWLGLNCAACHTGEVSYKGTPIRIDGGPALGDLDAMTDALDAAMIETRDTPAKWDRFAVKVLGSKDNPGNRALLKSSVTQWIDWQLAAAKLNKVSERAGLARVDAFGHIYNKVVQFSGAPNPIVNVPDAPVSYPFLWDISRQGRVQWNGVAQNSRLDVGGGRTIEYGALGRNAGEVIGVFGEVVITPASGIGQTFDGYRSSLQTKNLDRLETLLMQLQSPKWPTIMPKIDAALAQRGDMLFDAKCASCHKPRDTWEAGKPIEVMVTFKQTAAQDLTDIWMACNAFTYEARSGLLEGTKSGFVSGDKLKAKEKVVTLLATTVKGSLVGKKGDIIASAADTFLGVRRPPVVFTSVRSLAPPNQKQQRRNACLAMDDPLLAYKARPLDGIWATAPYLHNGSVPTLYHLLLPAKDRPKTFWLGSRDYDPKHVGYVWDNQPQGRNFLFRTATDGGAPIEGNNNVGHEYGAAQLSEDDRWALVEYMKTL